MEGEGEGEVFINSGNWRGKYSKDNSLSRHGGADRS
jgi:hypothetical protein